MFEYDQKKISEVAGNFTIRLMTRDQKLSPPAVPVPSRCDRVKFAEDEPTPRAEWDGGCREEPTRTPEARSKLIGAPSTRCGPTTCSCGQFGFLGRMFRCSRVAPLQTQCPGPPAPAPAPPSTKTNLPAVAAEESSALGAIDSRLGDGADKRRSVRPWTSRSEKDSSTVDSSKSRTRKGRRILQSNRVVPLANQAIAASLGEGQNRPHLPETKSATDLSSADTYNGLWENTEARKALPMLLGRLLGLFNGCFGKRSRSSPPEKPHARKAPQNSEDEDQNLYETTTETPRRPGEKVGCFPWARATTVVAPRSHRMFWVGSSDESEHGDMGCSMGHVLSSETVVGTQENYRNLKMVANKQTSVHVADLQRATLELENEQQSKMSDQPSSDESDDEDEGTIYPTINKKDLRQVSKESGRPLILGRGQSGVVRLMRLRRPDGGSSLVAVKRLMGSSSGAQTAMKKEISALRAVEDCRIFPRVVGVIDKQSFAQEFIGNPKSTATLSITKALRGKPPISLLNWVLIIHDVITGLIELHQSGWAHCDLQTNNVLLWRDKSQSDQTEVMWEGRIIDLGNSKRLEGPTRRCLSLTPSNRSAYYRECRHIPAEVVEGQVPYGVASDVYSMGILIQDIASRVAAMFEIMPLAEKCLTDDPERRLSLRALLKQLNVFCQDHTGYRMSPKEQNRTIAYV